MRCLFLRKISVRKSAVPKPRGKAPGCFSRSRICPPEPGSNRYKWKARRRRARYIARVSLGPCERHGAPSHWKLPAMALWLSSFRSNHRSYLKQHTSCSELSAVGPGSYSAHTVILSEHLGSNRQPTHEADKSDA